MTFKRRDKASQGDFVGSETDRVRDSKWGGGRGKNPHGGGESRLGFINTGREEEQEKDPPGQLPVFWLRFLDVSNRAKELGERDNDQWSCSTLKNWKKVSGRLHLELHHGGRDARENLCVLNRFYQGGKRKKKRENSYLIGPIWKTS